MNAWRSPGWILSNHTEDQGANIFTDTLPSSYLADSGDPPPIQTESRSMPVHDRSRSDQDESLPPPGPPHSQRNPEQFVQSSQSTARSLRVQSQQLPTESQVFEDEVRPTTERTDQPAEEMPERHDYGKNFWRKRPNQALRQVIDFAGVRPFGEAQGLFRIGSETARRILRRKLYGQRFCLSFLFSIYLILPRFFHRLGSY